MRARINKHRGGDFDDFLKEEGIYEEVSKGAEKKILAAQLERAMIQQDMTIAVMARRMRTSRASICRLLDGSNRAVTLNTLQKAASVLGRRWKIELVKA